jgi:predicted nucleic acid-binding protein
MIAADTSVLVPAIVGVHEAHAPSHEACRAVTTAIGPAHVEAYAVLTRLPHPYTVPPQQANSALRTYGSQLLVLQGADLSEALDHLAHTRLVGGATYDALIGLTAARHGVALLTRDRRAAGLYQRLGVDVRWVDA